MKHHIKRQIAAHSRSRSFRLLWNRRLFGAATTLFLVFVFHGISLATCRSCWDKMILADAMSADSIQLMNLASSQQDLEAIVADDEQSDEVREQAESQLNGVNSAIQDLQNELIRLGAAMSNIGDCTCDQEGPWNDDPPSWPPPDEPQPSDPPAPILTETPTDMPPPTDPPTGPPTDAPPPTDPVET